MNNTTRKRCVLVLVLQFIATSAMAETAATTTVATSAPALNSAGNLMQVLFGLALVLALMFGVAWIMKRFGMARTTGTQAVKLVGGVSVGNRERVLVVEVNDQWIVVGVAPGRVNALATLPRGTTQGSETAGAMNAAQTTAKSFSAWLNQKKAAASEHGAS